MGRRLVVAGVLALVAATPGAGALERPARSLGGVPLELVAARGALWALVCDANCGGDGRRSVGRLLRLDARSGEVEATAAVRGSAVLGVGGGGVFLADFWSGTVRRLDPRTLRATARLRLELPYELAPGDRAFAPSEVEVGARDVWVATRRGMLVHADSRLCMLGSVRLPRATTGRVALVGGSVWVGQDLLGVYRVDPARHRVTARLFLGLGVSGDRLYAARGGVVVVGEGAAAVVDSRRARVRRIARLPAGPLAVASDRGSLWIGRIGGSRVERLEPDAGRRTSAVRLRVGNLLAVAGGRLWTVTPDGALRSAPL